MRLTSHTLNENMMMTKPLKSYNTGHMHPNHLTLPHWEPKYYKNKDFYSITQSEIQCTNK